LRHYRSSKCESKLINVEDIDDEGEELLDYLIPPPESLGTCTGSGLVHPVTVSRNGYRNASTTTNEEEVNDSNLDVFSMNYGIVNTDLDDEDEYVHEIEDNKYIKFQKLSYEQIYGFECFYVNSFDEMVDLIRTTYAFNFQKKMLRRISICMYWVENRLSNRGQLVFIYILYLKLLLDYMVVLRWTTNTIVPD